MKTFESYEAFLSKAKSLNISDTKLEKAAKTYHLPIEGTFTNVVAFENAENEEFNHLAIEAIDQNGNTYTISGAKLQAIGVLTTTPKESLSIVQKVDKKNNPILVIQGGKSLNPLLGGNIAKMLWDLQDRNFTTEKVEMWALPFGKMPDVSKGETPQSLVFPREFYKVTLKPVTTT